MRHKGNVLEFKEERLEELKTKFYSIAATNPGLTVKEIYRLLARQPVSRFYVSEMRAKIVISQRERTGEFPPLSPGRRAMYEEIYQRYRLLRDRQPKLSRLDTIYTVVHSQAPCFYLTPESMQTMMSQR